MRESLWFRRAVGALGMVLAAGYWGFVGAPPGWAEARNPKGVAVIIGNGDYEHRDVPEVKYARRDAEAFRRYVTEVLGFDPENVIHLKDATRRQMFSALGTKRDPRSDLWSYLDPEGGSEVVVFYSGHGVPGERDKRGYLLPVDADPKEAEEDGYPIDLLYTNLDGLAEAKSVRVYLDACFSGGSPAGGLIRDASPVYVSAEMPLGTGGKVTALTAATGKQIASWDAEARHGLFTHHLLNALYGKGDADGDGKVTAKETKRYLDRWMTRAARRTHKRIQEASLLGAEEVVLTAALAGGGYPERPALGGGSGATQTTTKVRGDTETGQHRGSAPSAESSFPRKREPTSRAAAGPSPAALEAGLGLKREVRVLVQRGLTGLKFEAGPADGLFGKKTRGSIKAWQEAKGLPETGYLTKEQAEALKSAGEAAGRAEEERKRKAKELAEREAERKARQEAERRAREEALRAAEAERRRRETEAAERQRKQAEEERQQQADEEALAALRQAIGYYGGTGAHDSIDRDKARQLFGEAARSGHALAVMWLARSHFRGLMGFAKDEARGQELAADAIHEVKRLAKNGDREAMFLVGSAYVNGLGVSQSDMEAVKWYRKAAEQGHTPAQNNLGNMYHRGRGVPQSDTEAVKWLRKAAEQGNASAQNNLGNMYRKGRGVPQSDTEAVKWLRKAAEQGRASAQNNLGYMYRKGRGVPQSDTEAVKWYRKAAEQGHASAQNNLGNSYRRGRGVPQSDTEAVKWLRKAANQGNKIAKENLSEMGF